MLRKKQSRKKTSVSSRSRNGSSASRSSARRTSGSSDYSMRGRRSSDWDMGRDEEGRFVSDDRSEGRSLRSRSRFDEDSYDYPSNRLYNRGREDEDERYERNGRERDGRSSSRVRSAGRYESEDREGDESYGSSSGRGGRYLRRGSDRGRIYE